MYIKFQSAALMALILLAFGKVSWAEPPPVHIDDNFTHSIFSFFRKVTPAPPVLPNCAEIPALRVKLAYFDGFLETSSDMQSALFQHLGPEHPDRFLVDAFIANYRSEVLVDRLPVLNKLLALEESCK